MCVSRSLLLASAFNWTPLVEKLLENETPTSVSQLTNKNKQNALHIAADAGSLESMELLLDAGIEIEALCKLEGSDLPVSALFLATERCHVEAMELLLRRGASTNHPTGRSPLFCDFDPDDENPSERLPACKLLLDWGADTTVSYQGLDCLTWACYHNAGAVAEILLDTDAERGGQLARLDADWSRLAVICAAMDGACVHLCDKLADFGAHE